MSKLSMDTWISANDDAIQAKELRARFIEAAKDYAELAASDPDTISGHFFKLNAAMLRAAGTADNFINRILDNQGSLSCGLMQIAVEKYSWDSPDELNDYQLVSVLSEFIGLVARFNPAQSTTKEEE